MLFKNNIVFFIVLFYKLDVFQSYPPVRVDTILLFNHLKSDLK